MVHYPRQPDLWGERSVMNSHLFRVCSVMILIALILRPGIATAQLSKRQIVRNNSRLMTYRGNIKNKYGSDKHHASVGITLNALNYYGDLAPLPNKISSDISLTKVGAGVTYTYPFAPHVSVRGGFMCGTISGSDASADAGDMKSGVYRYQRNLSFRNRIQELSMVFVFNFFDNEFPSPDQRALSPYVFVGVAVLHHNPQAKIPATDLQGRILPNAGEWVNLRTLGTEGQLANLHTSDVNYGNKPYSLMQPAIPVGLGASLALDQHWSLSCEVSLRILFTDYIDDVSRNYVDLGAFGNNELAKAMSYRTNEIVSPNYQYTSERDGTTYNVLAGYGSEHDGNLRGNKKDNDMYTVGTIQVSYFLGRWFNNKPKHR